MVSQTRCSILTLVLCGLGFAGSLEIAERLGTVAQANASEPADDRAEIDFFEQRVRPLLLRRCGECHVEDQAGGFSLASRDALLQGGDSGPAIVPGNSRSSLLVSAIRRQADTPMPPDHPLSEAEIGILEHWIQQGAHWSADLPTTESEPESADHWAFQPIGDPAIPTVSQADWPRTEVDPFILRRLEDAGILPSPQADRRTLIRRASYALTGLPPTSDEVDAFLQSRDPDAYEKFIERLLHSPQYGQHQARMWLDLARYSDTKGYVYAREERFWVHAWNYRDWVVRALNQDMPYDRFLLLQIAADQIDDRGAEDLAAMGFLTLGRRFLGVKHDIIDDRIDVLCRGTMALTVSCARCHDHKYDPIPTADYYSLYGVFDSCSEQLTPLPEAHKTVENRQSDVRKKIDQLRSTLQTRRLEQAERVRQSFEDYLWAQTELHKYPSEAFGQIFAKDDLLPAFVRRFEDYLSAAEKRQDPVFVAWRGYRSIPQETFADESPQITAALQTGEFGNVNRHVLKAFQEPPESLRQVADRYAGLFHDIDEQWRTLQSEPGSNDDSPTRLDDPDAEELRQVLYGPESPCVVLDRAIVHSEDYFASDAKTELWKLQGDLDRAILKAGESAPFAITLVDNDRPTEPRIFRRGNSLDQGAEVSRHFLTLFEDGDPQPFSEGSGRLELARRIVDPLNPLTARVIVNRIWAQHFETGLVTTTSDFGSRAEPPSHPELLDFLARRFMEEGWSLKKLHRRILLSAAYRQNSFGPDDSTRRAKATELDPENRLLWRMTPHRLTFEELRDSLLAAGRTLDERVGGKPRSILESPFSQRRTLYALVDRQFLPSSFRVFDFANPDLHIAQRNETTIPQQSLFLMNHPFVVHQASQLVNDLDSEQDPGAAIETLFQRVLRRPPSRQEREEALTLLAMGEVAAAEPTLPTAQDWQYGFGAMDEPSGRVIDFTPLPHFNGDAWQGGDAYPDSALGWVQLTATGGHPGNDREHASIRRWVAPRTMTVGIQSQLMHEPAAGDGVRAFIVSSRQGTLQSAKVHQDSAAMNLGTLEVTAGETIDFVVDIDKVLNSDQYRWTIEIDAGSESDESHQGPRHWHSEKDFSPMTVRTLSPLGQLAQVLFCTNEFMFVD